VLHWTNPSPPPKLHLDLFIFALQLTAVCPLHFTMGRPFLPQNYPFALGSGPHLIHRSLDLRATRVQCQVPSREFWSLCRHPATFGLGPVPAFKVYRLLFRPHRSTACVDAAYCYRLSSVVCRFVGLPLYRSSEPCKNGMWVGSPNGKGHFNCSTGVPGPLQSIGFQGIG